MFSFEWMELCSALEHLAASPAQKDRVRAFVGGIEKQSTTLGRAETLELILTAAHLTQHEAPEQLEEEARARFLSH